MKVIASQSLFLLIFSVLASQIHCEPTRSDPCICELEELKLKVTRLESVLLDTAETMDARMGRLAEMEKLIKDMEYKIQYLQSAIFSIKDNSLTADEGLITLEKEVQVLWVASRKNNFDLHVLHCKVDDATDRLDVVTSQVEKMEDIVAEQWIQIQQLEQALQFTEMRTMDIRAQVGYQCTFLKIVNSLSSKHIPEARRMLDGYQFGKESTMNSYVSQTLQLFRRMFSAVRKYHHELQGLIRLGMERYEFSAALAYKEVVFFVASAIITFPVLGAWILLSSHLI